jgi:hypothetical protein
MQRQIVDGIPYFLDKHNGVFVWDSETTPYRLGTYDPKTTHATYNDGVVDGLTDRLSSWRSKQLPRPRKPAGAPVRGTKGRGNRSKQAAPTADSDGEE